MTLLARYLSHYVAICQRSQAEKFNGWQLAQEAAKNYPDLLGGLPDLLKAEMLRQKAGGKCEIRTPN